MYGKILLKIKKGNKLDMSNYNSIGYHFQESLPYPVLIGLGKQLITDHDYYWDNRNRADNHCLIQYTIRGQGELVYQGTCYKQNPGDIFLIKIPDKNKYYLPSSSQLWEFIYLEFSNESIPIFSQITNFVGPCFFIGNNSQVTKKIENIYQMALKNKISNVYKNSKLAYHLLMDLLEASSTTKTKIANNMDLAKNYIDANFYSNTINLDEIAEEIGISKFHLSREFHNQFGITINQYLTTVRIEQACRLLKQKNTYSIKQISEITGFSNDSYFGKVFKKLKGQTPFEYRNLNNKYDIVRIIHKKAHINNLK